MTSVFEDWAHSHRTILANCEDSCQFQANAQADFYPHQNSLLTKIAEVGWTFGGGGFMIGLFELRCSSIDLGLDLMILAKECSDESSSRSVEIDR